MDEIVPVVMNYRDLPDGIVPAGSIAVGVDMVPVGAVAAFDGAVPVVGWDDQTDDE